MIVNKVCPVVLRRRGLSTQILVFRHPLAGSQLVKGTVEPDESPETAALRELSEESGIAGARIVSDLGESDQIADGQIWYFFLVATEDLADEWMHHTADDGGHDFSFFWSDLAHEPDEEWHPTFRRAISHIRAALTRPDVGH